VLGVDDNNHRSGLLGLPRICARVKVPGRENRGRFVVEDCLPDIWKSSSSSWGRKRRGRLWIASCTAVGARTRVHQGLSPTGNDWLSALVRESKKGAYEAAGVALSVTVREMEPRGLTVAEKPKGRRQFDSRRTRAAMAGKVAAMVRASG